MKRLMISPREMTGRLAIHSCRAEPIIPEGWTVPNGYLLRGPRGNRHAVGVDHMGNIPEDDLDLWLAGIQYGDSKVVIGGVKCVARY